ncbi:hypothetical protein G6F35_012483 [Rhizopus arrhizus]|nr:hypothetical protein G6F35_012483 [Rhizopus arrhizus]
MRPRRCRRSWNDDPGSASPPGVGTACPARVRPGHRAGGDGAGAQHRLPVHARRSAAWRCRCAVALPPRWHGGERLLQSPGRLAGGALRSDRRRCTAAGDHLADPAGHVCRRHRRGRQRPAAGRDFRSGRQDGRCPSQARRAGDGTRGALSAARTGSGPAVVRVAGLAAAGWPAAGGRASQQPGLDGGGATGRLCPAAAGRRRVRRAHRRIRAAGFLGALRGRELQFAAADDLPLFGGVGRARRLAADVGTGIGAVDRRASASSPS